jgi:hypothetical protein
VIRLAGKRPERPLSPEVSPDPALPGLAALSDPATAEPILAEALGTPLRMVGAEVIRHKPGRRCLFRFRLELGNGMRTVYAKTYASDRGPGVSAALRALYSVTKRSGGPRVPEPIAYVDAYRLLVIGEVSGGRAEPALATGDEALSLRIAEALHRLHRSGAQLPRHHDLEDELAPLGMRRTGIVKAMPHLAVLADECLARAHRGAEDAWSWRRLPVHRDCYADQVVTGADIGLVDLDDAAMSEPAVDVANFAAHLRLSALRSPRRAPALGRSRSAFLAAYRHLDPDLDPRLVQFLEGTTLLRLADIHRSRPGGSLLAGRLLEVSRWRLERTA